MISIIIDTVQVLGTFIPVALYLSERNKRKKFEKYSLLEEERESVFDILERTYDLNAKFRQDSSNDIVEDICLECRKLDQEVIKIKNNLEYYEALFNCSFTETKYSVNRFIEASNKLQVACDHYLINQVDVCRDSVVFASMALQKSAMKLKNFYFKEEGIKKRA